MKKFEVTLSLYTSDCDGAEDEIKRYIRECLTDLSAVLSPLYLAESIRVDAAPIGKTNTIKVAASLDRETQSQYRITVGDKVEWLPQYLCEWDGSAMQMPEWLAIEKGLLQPDCITIPPESK